MFFYVFSSRFTTLDRKKSQLFNYYYHKFEARDFDEKDFYSFLVLVGEEAQEIEAVQALAHFIVHRENSIGYVEEYLDMCKEIITNLEKTEKPRKIEHLFSFKEMRNGFNALFLKLGYRKLPADVMNDFMLCLISLLQDVKLLSGSARREVGHLSFAASSKELFLMGNMKTLSKGRYIPVTFPILSVQNIYEKITPQDDQDTPYLFNGEIMETVNIDGKLMITFPNI